MMNIIQMPNPTTFTQDLYGKADKLDSAKLRADAYWRAIADVADKALPAGLGESVSYPSVPGTISSIKAAQPGPVYPVK